MYKNPDLQAKLGPSAWDAIQRIGLSNLVNEYLDSFRFFAIAVPTHSHDGTKGALELRNFLVLHGPRASRHKLSSGLQQLSPELEDELRKALPERYQSKRLKKI